MATFLIIVGLISIGAGALHIGGQDWKYIKGAAKKGISCLGVGAILIAVGAGMLLTGN